MKLMINKYIKSLLSLLFLLLSSTVLAQIRGVVTDSLTNERLMYISVYYEDKGIGVTTNENGEYLIRTQSGWDELTFSAVGYKKKVIKIDSRKKTVNVKLVPDDILLAEVVVKPKKERYSRKNNPAVDFMRKVIENKKYLKLEENDFYSFDKYQKMKTSLSNITEEKLKKGIYKRFAFLKDQMEPSVLTDSTYILPLSVQETASSTIYRKDPESEKEIIRGFNSSGIEEFFSTGDMLSTVLTNVFADINIYDDDIRLLQRRFVSPIGRNAISFYKFYLMDTIQVGQDECVHLTFVPQNSMDFGFTGHLYVLKDSTYAVKKCTMNLPKKTGVNFVESMDIIQEFQQLEDGNWVLTDDDMIVELKLIKSIEGVEVQRTTKYTNYSFETIGEHFFNIRGDVIKQADMMNQNEEFWSDVRQVPLTETESNMDLFINHLESIPGFKVIIFGAKALIENFVEIGNPSKFDIGPINTIMTSNYLEGFRMRLSGKTTAAFNPHWFLEGYGAYGFKDKRWKYFGEVTYSFKKSDFFPWEFPKHYLSLSYKNDVMAPMDKYLMTDKDNVFVSFKVSPVEHMSYVRDATLTYEKETHSGFSVKATAKHRQDEPAGKLEYLKNNEEKTPITKMNTTEFGVSLSYSPGQTYINTKQRRRPVTLDAPVFKLSHTMGVKGLGGDYKFNLTEASIWKRFWLSSWGKLDITLNAGAQWNRVPFPLLILPAANLSYITQNNETFNLINNMEFLNDRYVSLALTYDMNGKLFNRIPLIKKLKWREVFRIRGLYGHLTDKNNPYISNNEDLFLFPTNNGEVMSHIMDKKTPYLEASFGIYNIFKVLHIEYVHRLTYRDLPNINKNGVRFMIRMVF